MTAWFFALKMACGRRVARVGMLEPERLKGLVAASAARLVQIMVASSMLKSTLQSWGAASCRGAGSAESAESPPSDLHTLPAHSALSAVE
jgi:hypothetical protein